MPFYLATCECRYVCMTNIGTCHMYNNSKSTLDKSIPMVPNPLSTNGEDEKPAKLEADTSHQTSMMPPDKKTIVDSSIYSQPLDRPVTYDKLRPLQPLNQCGTYDRLIKVRL